MGDLFNLDRALTPSERRRLRGGTQAKGYAAMPGTGPKGETCGSCDHLVRKRLAKVYRKCGLMERHWTGGKGTDVLTTAPACRNWTAIEEQPAEAAPKKAARAPKPLPPPTDEERRVAGEAARALRAAIADPTTRGAESVVHIDLARPRRGEWWTTWANLPGFVRVNGYGGHYWHACLPDWTYTRREIVAEMIPDLEALAEHGVRPTEVTSKGAVA